MPDNVLFIENAKKLFTRRIPQEQGVLNLDKENKINDILLSEQ